MFRVRRWGLSLPLVVSGFLVACEGEDGRPEYPSYDQDLEQLIADEPELTTFAELIAETSFAPQLKGGNSYSIFAPSNSAFAGMNKDELKANPEALSVLLRFHIMGGTVDTKLLDLGGEFTTITSTIIRVSSSNGTIGLTDYTGATAQIVKGDTFGKNGVLHVIDRVLTPPPAPVTTGNLSQELTKAGLTAIGPLATRAGVDFATVMGPVTVFAPNDAAITALGNITPINNAILQNILYHHVVGGAHPSSELASNPALRSWANLGLVVAGGGATVGGATVGAKKDITATNGTIHELNGVIVPPTTGAWVSGADSLMRTATAITRADASIATALAPTTLMGAPPNTFFAPAGTAWNQGGLDPATSDATALTTALGWHIVVGQQLLLSDLDNGEMLTTLSGTVSVSRTGTEIALVRGTRRAVLDQTASNVRTVSGVVHIATGRILGGAE